MKCTNMEIVTLENIKELVSQTETEQIEFKETTGQLERAMETLCALDRKSTRLNSSHVSESRMPSAA